eukprot:s2116_g6.t1
MSDAWSVRQLVALAGFSGAAAAALFLLGRKSAQLDSELKRREQEEVSKSQAKKVGTPRSRTFTRPPTQVECSIQENHLVTFVRQLPTKPLLPRGGGEVHSTAKLVLLCASGKGGVGKSTVSVNLAYSMKQMGFEVGLLDLDIYGPSLPELVRPLSQAPIRRDGALRCRLPAMAEEQKLLISVKNTFLDFRPEQEEAPIRRSNSWSSAERSWDHEETPGGAGGEGAVVGVEEREAVEEMEVVDKMEAVEEADHWLTQPAQAEAEAVSKVCSVTIRDCNPCVYFMSQRGCDGVCGWSHFRHNPRVPDKNKRPVKATREKYKEQVRRALALEEPERQRELQRLVLQHSYLQKVIMKSLDEVPLDGQVW